jgi:hypothetical protein
MNKNIKLFSLEKITLNKMRYSFIFFAKEKRKLYEKHVFIASSGR